jgi:hypothetical protein
MTSVSIPGYIHYKAVLESNWPSAPKWGRSGKRRKMVLRRYQRMRRMKGRTKTKQQEKELIVEDGVAEEWGDVDAEIEEDAEQ